MTLPCTAILSAASSVEISGLTIRSIPNWWPSSLPLIGIELPDQEMPFVDFIRPYTLPDDKKVMVNVGSVGQPRDRDPRACLVTYILETRRVELHRVPYDIETAQNKIYMARLPDRFGLRLAAGR